MVALFEALSQHQLRDFKKEQDFHQRLTYQLHGILHIVETNKQTNKEVLSEENCWLHLVTGFTWVEARRCGGGGP